DLHTTFWMAAKLCSACKVEVSEQHAQELMDAVEAIHNMFWATKGRDVSWVRAS
ncbi:MAG: superoxide dismutase [Ni], partial [Candidatus Thermoplasmatota archaeon]|nr:superoxide dismutase [Ni] [Candidatus Thermoplasmatota archaeon]